MYCLAAASWPRLSETEPKWFVFETSCYAFGGRICRFVNKVNMFYCIILILLSSKLFLSMYTFIMTAIVCQSFNWNQMSIFS